MDHFAMPTHHEQLVEAVFHRSSCICHCAV